MSWRVVVEVPDDLPESMRDSLLKAVTEAVIDWEPPDRDQWDAHVYGEPGSP